MAQKYMNPAQAEARESATSKTGRKEELVKTGIRLVMEKGIQNTSVEDITKACGFSKGSFYYYFTSKDDFLLAAIMGLNVDDAFEEARQQTDLTIVQRVAFYMRRYAELMRDSIGIEFCRIWAQLVIRYENLERYHRDLGQMETLLREGIAGGELREDMDVPAAAKVIVTFIYGAAFEWHMGGEENDVVRLTEQAVPMVEAYLKLYQIA